MATTKELPPIKKMTLKDAEREFCFPKSKLKKLWAGRKFVTWRGIVKMLGKDGVQEHHIRYALKTYAPSCDGLSCEECLPDLRKFCSAAMGYEKIGALKKSFERYEKALKKQRERMNK